MPQQRTGCWQPSMNNTSRWCPGNRDSLHMSANQEKSDGSGKHRLLQGLPARSIVPSLIRHELVDSQPVKG
jgi:hypothetical protein